MAATQAMIGPQDHGRRMTLVDYEFIKTKPGYRYELSRGVIEVSKIPNPYHGCFVDRLHMVLTLYRHYHNNPIECCLEPSSCKILIWEYESERHPDLAIYLSPPPSDDDFTWRIWLPEIVIDIISPYTDRRDEPEKREEFLAVGIKEYWLLDLQSACAIFLTRQGSQWRQQVLKSGDVYETRLLPGFQLIVAELFQ